MATVQQTRRLACVTLEVMEADFTSARERFRSPQPRLPCHRHRPHYLHTPHIDGREVAAQCAQGKRSLCQLIYNSPHPPWNPPCTPTRHPASSHDARSNLRTTPLPPSPPLPQPPRPGPPPAHPRPTHPRSYSRPATPCARSATHGATPAASASCPGSQVCPCEPAPCPGSHPHWPH